MAADYGTDAPPTAVPAPPAPSFGNSVPHGGRG